MLVAIITIICPVFAAAAEWIYRNFIPPINVSHPELLALAQHFERNGIEVRSCSVRRGFRYSQFTVAFEIAAVPLPVAVTFRPTGQSAIEFEAAKRSPIVYTARNGRLVMSLPTRRDNTREMAMTVTGVFSSFDDEAVARMEY